MHYAPFQWCNQVWVWLSWRAGLCAPGRNTAQNSEEEQTTSEPKIYLFWVASTHWERILYQQQPAEHKDILTERFTAKHVCYEANNDCDTQHVTYSCRTKILVTINLKNKQTKDSKTVSGGPALWSSGQSLWLLIMRSRVRFPVLPWEFSLKGRIPAVTMVWVG